jgi:hypothetical protein
MNRNAESTLDGIGQLGQDGQDSECNTTRPSSPGTASTLSACMVSQSRFATLNKSLLLGGVVFSLVFVTFLNSRAPLGAQSSHALQAIVVPGEAAEAMATAPVSDASRWTGGGLTSAGEVTPWVIERLKMASEVYTHSDPKCESPFHSSPLPLAERDLRCSL